MTAESTKPALQEKLATIQQELNVPKENFNDFGKYEYRSCEDILQALKPILNGAVILLTDEIVQIGERYYVQATATLAEGEESISTKAYAREEETKKGMDGSQITGSASSYARKYALNGLFAIDDTKDSDTTNTHDKDKQPPQTPKQLQPNETVKLPDPPKNGDKKEPHYAPLVGVITIGQRDMINRHAIRLGIAATDVQAKFNIENLDKLTKQEASDLIGKLVKMKEWV